MRRINLTDEQLAWMQSALNENRYTESELGSLFRERFPGVFPDDTTGRNLCYRVKQRMTEAGMGWAKQKNFKVDRPRTSWLDANPELVIQYEPKLAFITDVHAGAHDPDVIEFIAETVERRGIDAVVWGGDILDNAYIGHKGTLDSYASTHEEVVFGCAQVIQRIVRTGVVRHYFHQGNHDDKPFRGTQGEWTFVDFLEDKVFPQVDFRGCKIKATNRYYLTMRPRKPKGWPWKGPDNFPWRFTHQKEYSRIPLRTASRLASKLWMNVACAHQHHLGWTLHESGLVYVADSGCSQMHGAAAYKHMRDSTHPEHINGFLTIEQGQPHAWHYT